MHRYITAAMHLLVGAILASIFIHFKPATQNAKASNTTDKFKIAFVTKTAPYHDSAMRGFMKALKSDNPQLYDVRVYITEGQNKLLSTSILEEVTTKNPDLICVVGATLSQVAYAVTNKRKNPIPVVFIGASDPVNLGIVKSLQSSETNFTGVNMNKENDFLAVEIFKLLKPNTKHLLLPYCPLASGGNVEKEALYTKEALELSGTKVTLIPIQKLPEILPRVKGLIHQADAVMYLVGCLVDEASEGLIKVCNQHGVSLFANAPNSVKNGAAFGFGPDAQLVGAKAFQYVKQILCKGKKATELPVYFIEKGRKVGINLDAAKRQNLSLPEGIIRCLSNGVVYQNGEEL